MAGCQLFNSTFIILQSIIAHIAITVPMVCFPSHRASSPVSYSYHDKAQLRQTGVIGIVQSKRSIYIFKIGSRINRRNNRITTGGIKISRFPHHTVQIRLTIRRLNRKTFRFPPSFRIHLTQIRLFQHKHGSPRTIPQNTLRFQIRS